MLATNQTPIVHHNHHQEQPQHPSPYSSPEKTPSIQTQQTTTTTTTTSTTQTPEQCDCTYYHSQGLGCPCNALYAIKVGRKATERILFRSKFFTHGEHQVTIQNENERAASVLSNDHHNCSSSNDNGNGNGHLESSSNNEILKIDGKTLSLGRMLGKGGFCVVYETSLPERLVLNDCSNDSSHNHDHENGKFTSNGEAKSEQNTNNNNNININNSNTNNIHNHEENGNNNSNHSTKSDQHYCVKFLKPNVLPERKKFARGIADLAIEAHFLASLHHPHILKIRGVSQSFQLFEPTSPSFLSDLTYYPGLKGGCFLLLDQLTITLDKKINRHWKETQDKWNSFLNRTVQDIRGIKRKMFRLERVTVALQLAQAMQYLHQNNICYRDLKPDNIGFDVNDSLKLFDFGLAKELKDYKRFMDGTYQLTANTGSKRYMAPEVALKARYNLSVDVFSFGILFWEICSLEKPFDGFTEMEHMTMVVQRGHRPQMDVIKSWPQEIRHIISKCWHPISNERPSFCHVVETLTQTQSEMLDKV